MNLRFRSAACLLAGLTAGAVFPTHALQPGDPVRFAAQTLDGRLIKVEDYRGQLLVVHFWSTWHRPSVRQLETLRAVLDHTAELGVAMVGIGLDDPGEGTVMVQTLLAGATAGLSPQARWDHVLGHAQTPGLDTRFFDEAYAIPAVWVVSPDGQALWQGHPSELPQQLLGFLASHPPTALPGPSDALVQAQTPPESAGAPDADAQLAQLLAERAALEAQAGREIDASVALAAEQARASAVAAALDALRAADAAWTADPPDPAAMLAALASLDPATHADPLIAAHGQRWSRVLAALDTAQQDALLTARDALPEAGFALDTYLRSAAAVDATQGQYTADPARIAPRVQRALRDVQRGRGAEAYKEFKSVLNIGLGLPEADEALVHVLRYEADQELMATIAAADAELAARTRFNEADGLAKSFQEEQAAVVLRQLLDEFPDTAVAAEAKRLLENLDLPE